MDRTHSIELVAKFIVSKRNFTVNQLSRQGQVIRTVGSLHSSFCERRVKYVQT